MSRALALIGVILLSGCYAYLPQRPGSIPPGSDVRVHLSQEGVDRMVAAYGRGAGVVEGKLDEWADTVTVSVPLPPAPGTIDRGLRSKIVFRQADVVGVDLRRKDQTKTIVVSA